MILSRSHDCPRCGNGHSNLCYVVYTTGNWCYSCNTGSSKSSSDFAFQPSPVIARKSLIIPEHTFKINEFSTTVLEWLYSYHVYDDLIRKYHIAYCPAQAGKDESVILPLLDGETSVIVEYQRRYFPKAFESSPGVRRHLFINGEATSHSVWLVEDYISAIRVGAICPSLCLFGTDLSLDKTNYLIRNYKNIIIWLDNDGPGIVASNKIKLYLDKISMNYAFKSINIKELTTEKQPKEYTPHEIKTMIKQ